MQLIEVKTKKEARQFVTLPLKIYKNTKAWIRPLDKDVEGVFHKETNKYFRYGECIRYLVLSENQEPIGRVAAFTNRKPANKSDVPTGGMGFFDCINDEKAAFLLFDACKEWLQSKGMEAMDGPINFGDRLRWCGLLVDGFDIEPNYCCNYNPPYYIELFENYGFQLYFKQFTYGRKTRDPFHPRIMEKAEKVSSDPNYHFEHLDKNKLDKYTEDFRIVYNKAWSKHGVPAMTSLQAKKAMKEIKPIMDEKIIWYGYYENEPIAFFLLLPEVNQLFKYVNGKLDLIGKLTVLYHQWRKSCNKMFGAVFGVVPEHQGKGVEGALIIATAKMVQDDYHRYADLEMNWIGDFNPKMIRVVEQVGGSVVKTHHTYRMYFDETKEFQRAPIIG